MLEFFKKIIYFLDQNKITYMLSGSVAMSIYTVPRATRDFDFVVHLKMENVKELASYFKEGFYCDEAAVKEAINQKGMFNIIDHHSGYKADFVILKDELYRKTEFERRRPVRFLDINIYVVSPEDLLLSKIIWIQKLHSHLQIEDIKALQSIPGLDWKYINHWIEDLKLNTFNLVNS